MGSEDAEKPGKPGKVDRTKARAADARVRAEGLKDRVVGSRLRSAPVDIAIRAYERDRDTGGGVLAAAVGFRLFLFMVPYVFLLFTIFGLSTRVAGKSPESVARSGGITGILGQALTSTSHASTGSQVILFVGATWAVISTANSALKVLNAACSLVWRVPVRRKAKKSAPFVFIGVVTVAVVLSVGLSKARDAQPGVGFALTLVTLILPALLWWRVSVAMEHHDAPEWALLPGAFLVALGTEILHLFTVYYLSGQVSSESEKYGALGAAMSVLLWAYLLGRLFIGSWVVNATLWTRFTDKQREAQGLPPEPVEPLVTNPGVLRVMRDHIGEVRKLLK